MSDLNWKQINDIVADLIRRADGLMTIGSSSAGQESRDIPAQSSPTLQAWHKMQELPKTPTWRAIEKELEQAIEEEDAQDTHQSETQTPESAAKKKKFAFRRLFFSNITTPKKSFRKSVKALKQKTHTANQLPKIPKRTGNPESGPRLPPKSDAAKLQQQQIAAFYQWRQQPPGWNSDTSSDAELPQRCSP